ncbi:MMPL family transporter [Priestia aryabhattai]|uniref:MMPL family transporter n=1 Tax=Priestia aryabhattai TaxID=412384 RepID=UPI003D2BA91B
MSKLLYKIGGWSARNKFKVLGGWIIIMIAILGIAFSMKPAFSEEMTIPGTASEKAADIISKEFPSTPNVGSIRMIFGAEGKDKLNSKEAQKAISDALDKISQDKSVKSIANPYEVGTINSEGTVAYADITYKEKAENITKKSKELVKDSAKMTKNQGIQTELNGDITAFKLEIGGISEVIGIVMAFIVLVVMFTSFLIAGLPIFTALIGLATSLGITFLATNFFNISSISMTLAIMIGLAVGIDYALFIFSKHRQQLSEDMDIHESIARATGTAGGAVVFAGLTVMVALCGLTVVGVPFLAVMGLTAAISVLMAMLISITLVPAVLAWIGNRMKPNQNVSGVFRFITKGGEKRQGQSTNWWGRFLRRQPLLITIISILLLLTISVPALHLRLGLPDDGMKAEGTPERQAYDLMAEGFGKGVNGPLVALIDVSNTSENKTDAINKIAKKLTELDNVSSTTSPLPSESGNYAIVNITPKTGPNDEETTNLVHDIRDITASDSKNSPHIYVTGMTAINIDIAEKLNDAIPLFAGLIVGFALLLLIVVFRSLLVPLTAVLGFLLTMTATLGFAVFVLQDGYLDKLFGIPAEGPILAFLPILVIGILFGLAMDYQVFLVSRMREEYVNTGNARESVQAGIKFSGPVVTAAGLIMIFVFASFIFAGDVMIKSMGLALAFGILFDAFIVRLTIIPGLMILMGKASWYLPKWLDNIIPNVDIEGHGLDELLKKEKNKEEKKHSLRYDK